MYFITVFPAAASCFINLVIKESDNNVKLIVLDRLEALRSKQTRILDSLIMDVLQILSSSADMEVRRKAISIVLSMTSSRNVEDVVMFFKKQLQKTQEGDFEKAADYRQLLIQSIHVTAIRFSEVAASVVHALMEFLGDSNNPSALDVVAFVREVVEKFPSLRATVTEKLIATLPEIKSGKVFRGVLWILGEYIETVQDVHSAMQEVRKVIGEVPILASEQKLLDEAREGIDTAVDERDKETTAGGGKPRVLADGTYATESAYTTTTTSATETVKGVKPPLRSMLSHIHIVY